jgi:hypothetical protein
MSKADRDQDTKDQAEIRPARDRGSANRRAHRFATALCLLLGLCLLLCGPAAASYESVGVFGEQSLPLISQPSGIAVNYTGAGGVPVGTVYVVNRIQAFS